MRITCPRTQVPCVVRASSTQEDPASRHSPQPVNNLNFESLDGVHAGLAERTDSQQANG